MKPTLIARLEKLNDWRLLAGIAALIVLFTEFIVAAMNLLLQGDITVDFLITGLVAALIVAPLGLVLLKRLLQVLTHNRQLQTEIAAEHDKQNLNLALITAQIFIWELDLPSGKIQYDDNQLPLLGLEFGQPPHDIQQWIELVHPHDRAIFMEKFQAALQPESPFFDLEYRFSPIPDSAQQSGSWNQDDAWSHSGSWSWLHTRGRVNQRDANGNPLLAGGTTMNITARKVAELQSLDAQKRFELIFNSSPDVMVISKLPEGIISNVNDAFVANTGYSKQDAIGNTTVGLGFWSDAERHKMTEAIKRDGYCRALEFEFTLRDGEKRTGSFSAVVSHLEGIPHLVSTIHDISTRKQMENALKASETRFRAIIEATPVPLALNNVEGDIVFLNRAFHETLGYTVTDISSLEDWWPLAYPDPQYRARISENWLHATEQAMASNSAITSIEAEVRCKNGQTRTFIIGGTPLAGDQAHLYLVSLYDITEQKHNEHALQASEHKLRTILDNVDAYIYLKDTDGHYLFAN
ncbi:MAG: PAS domain S-box protein, partial [Gallionella sp.]|nr:PAS domain S-box protein [Gallionella sp.]